MTKICEYDEQIIDPAKEKPQKAYLCEDCSEPKEEKQKENENILELMKRLEDKMDVIISLQKKLEMA